jgi:DTW domain-containing protein YfiP
MRAELCVCAEVPRLAPRTRLVVVMHHRELKATTNSARLALAAIDGSELRVRGRAEAPFAAAGLGGAGDGRLTLVLFPSEDAHPLDAAFVRAHPGPYTLVVPDGNWRQARKVLTREPALAGALRVRVPYAGPSRYHLRREPRLDALSTCEAIARALGVLEGPERGPDLQRRLEDVFQLMVRRTLGSRGWRVLG